MGRGEALQQGVDMLRTFGAPVAYLVDAALGDHTPHDSLPSAEFSFPGLGTEGPHNVAIALFSFPSIGEYDPYRLAVADDEACKAATTRFNESKCFSGYERTFLLPMFE